MELLKIILLREEISIKGITKHLAEAEIAHAESDFGDKEYFEMLGLRMELSTKKEKIDDVNRQIARASNQEISDEAKSWLWLCG